MFVYLAMIDSPNDESKFEKVYYKYRHLMYRVAFNILQNREDAEDVVQRSFIKIAKTIKKIGDPSSEFTKGYVLTIVQNQSIDLLRDKAKHPTLIYQGASTDKAIHAIENDITKFCLTQLPPRYKQVLVLKHVYGLSNLEIAKTMNLSLRNVITLDQRAKKKFREIYEKEEKM